MTDKPVTTPEEEKPTRYLTGEHKFYILIWLMILGSCTITSFSDHDKPLVHIESGCNAKSN